MIKHEIQYRLEFKDEASYNTRYEFLMLTIDSLDKSPNMDEERTPERNITSTRWIESDLDGHTIAKTLATAVDRSRDMIRVRPTDAGVIYIVGDTQSVGELRVETGLEVVRV
ncbi:hypothetical protein HMPREF0005_02878 [Achromobacter xylosoxidans C54]|uniref:hypothetical protein n=1 Tax=Alcaligenes xylosoxydans xylosoxydans TaxID=85698 RepID=UPI0001F437DD|nr:hypothetical protein [Achromobacter xylosoxidans]EFV84136.1 hypothetical protein HMPREF0005_02878 [Achromobacter xylosoxidans C54]